MGSSRADAPPRREPYQVADDVADLGVILRGTGASSVIGHSSGGYIALVAAQRLAIDQLVLYDPAVSIDGGFPAAWLPEARAAANSGDLARCMALTSAGINTHQSAARLPLVVQTMFCRLFLRTTIGASMDALLPTTLDETQEIVDHDGPASRWADISARVLLTYGKAGSPRLPRPQPGARRRDLPCHSDADRAPRPRRDQPRASRIGRRLCIVPSLSHCPPPGVLRTTVLLRDALQGRT